MTPVGLAVWVENLLFLEDNRVFLRVLALIPMVLLVFLVLNPTGLQEILGDQDMTLIQICNISAEMLIQTTYRWKKNNI